MKKWIGIALVVIILGSALPVFAHGKDGKYDFSFELFQGGLETAARDWPRIFASGKPRSFNKETGEWKEYDMRETFGGRVVIIPPYVVTVAHLVDVARVEIQMLTSLGVRTKGMAVEGAVEEKYWLAYPDGERIYLEKVVISREDDLALFQILDGSWVMSSGFVNGKSHELKMGHVAFLLGSPHGVGTAVRSGVVAGFIRNFSKKNIIQSQLEYGRAEEMIVLGIPAMPGDSGSPIVALRDGKMELIGILSHILDSLFTFMVPVDYIGGRLKELSGVDIFKTRR